MAYDASLAEKVRRYLAGIPGLEVEEKKMFSGLAFLVNGKMCVNVSGDNLMCRFDPAQQDAIAERNGYIPMVMKGKELKGYCYVDPSGFAGAKAFAWWMQLCLDYNENAVSSKSAKKARVKAIRK
jgi:hypothetical protein